MANKNLKAMKIERLFGREEEDEERVTISSSGDDCDEPHEVTALAITSSPNKGVNVRGSNSDLTSGTKRLSKDSQEESSLNRKKRQYNPRRWTPEDEIAVLHEIIDFKNKTGKYPSHDRCAFYESAKNVVNFQTNLRQFLEKVRHLEKKYVKKAKEGVEPSFKSDHDRERFKLSKVIWGDEELALSSAGHEDDGKGGHVETPGCVAAHSNNWFQKSTLLRSLEEFGVDSVLQKWSLVPTETKREIEEQSKLVEAEDLEIKTMEDMLSAKKREHLLKKKAVFDKAFSLISYH